MITQVDRISGLWCVIVDGVAVPRQRSLKVSEQEGF